MPCTTCNVQAPRTMLKKSLINRLGITARLEKISSIVRNSPNRSRENTKNQNPKKNNNHTKLPFSGDIHPSWVTYLPGTFWESPWITLCLRQLQGNKTLNSYGSNAAYPCVLHFSRGSQLPPSTPWSIFLENKCLRSSTSLWCHYGGTVRQLSVFQKGLLPLWKEQCKNIHHVNLFPFCTGRLPLLKQPKPLPARTLQPRCSGMFFRWAGI